jgi:hypothetical protein
MAQNTIIYNPSDVAEMVLSADGPKLFLLTASDAGKILPNPDVANTEKPYLHVYVPGQRGNVADPIKSFSQIGTLLDANKDLNEEKRRKVRLALYGAKEVGAVTPVLFGYEFRKRADGKFDVLQRPAKNVAGKEKSEAIDTLTFMTLVETEERKANAKPRA